jgi:FMN phosphatase YigB (HAD superfamily)
VTDLAGTADPRPDGPIEAVTFDFWNTLVQDTGGIRQLRLDTTVSVLSDHGSTVDRAELEAAFERAWDTYVAAWKANEPFDARDAVGIMLTELSLDPGLANAMVRVFTEPPPEWRPPLTDNIAQCLAELRGAGIRIGIICDVGMTPSTALRRYLSDHGILDQFDHWSFSDEVGVFKPDPRIFDHALAGLSEAAGRPIAPERTAHVGDLRRTDIAGARAHGLTAVRYSGAFDDPGDAKVGTDKVEGHLVVTDHAYLPAALGVTGPKPVPS